jgi:hypothetical protein
MRFRTLAARHGVSDEFFSLCEQKSSLASTRRAREHKRTLLACPSMPAVDVRRCHRARLTELNNLAGTYS